MINWKVIIRHILVLLFIILFLSVHYSSAAVIKLRPASTVKGTKVYVKDIAEIEALDAARKRIGNIKIGSSPLPGQEKNITSRLIRSKIFAACRGETPEIIQPGEIITVKRDYQVVAETSLQKLYHEYIQNRLKGKTFRVRNIKIKGNKKLPTGNLKLEACESRDKKNSGHIRMIVDALPEAGKKQRIMISGWVDVYENVVYAKNTIKKGTLIKERDLYTELTNITRYPPDLMDDVTSVAGQLAKKRIRKNSALRSTMIGISPAIKKGEMVKLLIQSGGLTVSTVGVATENACVGDQLRVKNLKSKKIVTGQVLDTKIIRVVF